MCILRGFLFFLGGGNTKLDPINSYSTCVHVHTCEIAVTQQREREREREREKMCLLIDSLNICVCFVSHSCLFFEWQEV